MGIENENSVIMRKPFLQFYKSSSYEFTTRQQDFDIRTGKRFGERRADMAENMADRANTMMCSLEEN